MIQQDGKFQFDKDKEAVHSYFVDYINQNTVFFHDLKEKLDYLIENQYYEEEFLSLYSFEEIKDVFKTAYAKKFRFPSFMSAFKFYNDYALKTNDKKKSLSVTKTEFQSWPCFLQTATRKKRKTMCA